MHTEGIRNRATPYLNRDPPHVAPLDGQEYARHSRGTKQAATAAKKAQVKARGEEGEHQAGGGSNAKNVSYQTGGIGREADQREEAEPRHHARRRASREAPENRNSLKMKAS